MSKATFFTAIILALIILKVFVPVILARESGQHEQAEVIHQVSTITPLSIEMVDQTMAVLSDGWLGMSHVEQEAFLTIYDPADTGAAKGCGFTTRTSSACMSAPTS